MHEDKFIERKIGEILHEIKFLAALMQIYSKTCPIPIEYKDEEVLDTQKQVKNILKQIVKRLQK